jgi:hypothetical protein
MDEEMRSFIGTHTWKLVPKPPDKKWSTAEVRERLINTRQDWSCRFLIAFPLRINLVYLNIYVLHHLDMEG